jgi:hypothetical protein
LNLSMARQTHTPTPQGPDTQSCRQPEARIGFELRRQPRVASRGLDGKSPPHADHFTEHGSETCAATRWQDHVGVPDQAYSSPQADPPCSLREVGFGSGLSSLGLIPPEAIQDANESCLRRRLYQEAF